MSKRKEPRPTTRVAVAAITATLLAAPLAGCDLPTTSDAYETNGAYATSDAGIAQEESLSPMLMEKNAAPGDDAEENASMPDASKIVRDASATLLTRDFERASGELDAVIDKFDAIVTSDSYDGGETSGESRHIAMRIDASRLDELVSMLKEGESWTVNSTNVDAQDMSVSYHDNERRIQSLETKYEFYKKKAEETTDERVMVEMTEKMIETLDEIEMLKSQNAQTDLDVKWSHVNIDLRRDDSARAMDGTNGVYQMLADAIMALPGNFVAALAWLLLMLVVALPPLAIIVAIAGIVIVAVKAYARKHPKVERQRAETRAERRRRLRAEAMPPSPPTPPETPDDTSDDTPQ